MIQDGFANTISVDFSNEARAQTDFGSLVTPRRWRFQEFTTSAPVQEGMKNALARLGKVDGGADAVTLNWETGRRLENVWHSVPMAQHRELAEKVKLSFEIETKGEEETWRDMAWHVSTNVGPWSFKLSFVIPYLWTYFDRWKHR